MRAGPKNVATWSIRLSMKDLSKFKNLNRVVSLVEWLNSHTLISKSALAAKADIDYKQFEKMLERKISMPDEVLDKVEMILLSYGYKIKSNGI